MQWWRIEKYFQVNNVHTSFIQRNESNVQANDHMTPGELKEFQKR
jgi:hypothetical protein